MGSVKTESLSNAICDKISASAPYREAEWICAYYPIRNEVDLRPLMIYAMRNHKRVALPKLLSKKGACRRAGITHPEMCFYEITDFNSLIPGHFGIMEPADDCERAVPGRALFLIPGVAFDAGGNRIGYGKGYYDRYFSKHSFSQGKNNCVLMGVAYQLQVADKIPIDEHDVGMEWLATEEGVCRL